VGVVEFRRGGRDELVQPGDPGQPFG
jgi:hypothetical protein